MYARSVLKTVRYMMIFFSWDPKDWIYFKSHKQSNTILQWKNDFHDTVDLQKILERRISGHNWWCQPGNFHELQICHNDILNDIRWLHQVKDDSDSTTAQETLFSNVTRIVIQSWRWPKYKFSGSPLDCQSSDSSSSLMKPEKWSKSAIRQKSGLWIWIRNECRQDGNACDEFSFDCLLH